MKAHPALTEEHEAFRETMRRFVAREIAPHAAAWDEAGEFPREMYRKAAQAGLFAPGFPEEYGGVPADLLMHVVLAEEIALAGSGGVHASLFSHQIGCPPIAAAGSEALKRRVLPAVLAGDKISALAITEPGGGSDVANLRTSARKQADEYVVNGEKTFITSGMRADFYTVAVRTGGPGAAGISLLLIERDRPGFTRALLKKMGWWCSDTASLHFDDVRVPVSNLIGEDNAGFRSLMRNFNAERLSIAAGAVGFAQACLDDALAWARSIGGLPAMRARADANASVLFDWIARTPWVENLAADPATRSNTSVCLRFADPDLVEGEHAAARRLSQRMVGLLAEAGAAHDIGPYRTAPPGLRIWCGSTVERADLALLTPWLDWAYAEARAALT